MSIDVMEQCPGAASWRSWLWSNSAGGRGRYILSTRNRIYTLRSWQQLLPCYLLLNWQAAKRSDNMKVRWMIMHRLNDSLAFIIESSHVLLLEFWKLQCQSAKWLSSSVKDFRTLSLIELCPSQAQLKKSRWKKLKWNRIFNRVIV